MEALENRMRRFARSAGLLFVALFLAGLDFYYVEFETGATYNWDKDRQQVAGLLFRPAGADRSAAVVLLHTCDGMQPHVISSWPRYLTGLGYVVRLRVHGPGHFEPYQRHLHRRVRSPG